MRIQIWDPPLARCSLCWLSWEDGKTGVQVFLQIITIFPERFYLFIISILPLSSPSPHPMDKQAGG